MSDYRFMTLFCFFLNIVLLVFAQKHTQVICDVSFHPCFIRLIMTVQDCSIASWKYGDHGKVCYAAKVLISFHLKMQYES